MKIQPIRISITDTKDVVNMYISASDSWGNEEQNQPPSYDAIALLTDEDGNLKKRLSVHISGDDYNKWDNTNATILKMFLDKYNFLKLIDN